MGRPVEMRNPMKKGMELERRDVRRPRERRAVVDQDVINVRATFAPRDRKRLHPFRGKRRRVLFVKDFAVDPVRIPLQCDRPVAKMRQEKRRDLKVVINDVELGELACVIENLIRI